MSLSCLNARKVWPLLSASAQQAPARRAIFGRRRKTNAKTRRYCECVRRVVRATNKCIGEQHAVADMCCVAGAITATTGLLVAGFGVFPRNQARIRLYLECVGCAMVLIGALIVLTSLKSRKSSRTHGANSARANSFSHNHHHHFGKRRDLISNAKQQQQRRSSLDESVASAIKRNDEERTLRTVRSACDIEAMDARAKPVTAAALITPTVTIDEAEETYDVGDDDDDDEEYEFSCDDENCTVSHEAFMCPNALDRWTPSTHPGNADDYYGDSHQPAIEAALSIVLAVATVAGCRAQDGQRQLQHQRQYLRAHINNADATTGKAQHSAVDACPCHCCRCLRHAVQVSSNHAIAMAKLL